MLYYQCELRRDAFYRTEWIEERGAKAGNKVELLPEKEFWEVVNVFPFAISEETLREKQKKDRNSLSSINR